MIDLLEKLMSEDFADVFQPLKGEELEKRVFPRYHRIERADKKTRCVDCLQSIERGDVFLSAGGYAKPTCLKCVGKLQKMIVAAQKEKEEFVVGDKVVADNPISRDFKIEKGVKKTHSWGVEWEGAEWQRVNIANGTQGVVKKVLRGDKYAVEFSSYTTDQGYDKEKKHNKPFVMNVHASQISGVKQ